MRNNALFPIVAVGIAILATAWASEDSLELALHPVNCCRGLSGPNEIAVQGGVLYVFDDPTNRLFAHRLDGEEIFRSGSIGSGPGEFLHPRTFKVNDDSIAVLDLANKRVEMLSKSGKYVHQYPISAGVNAWSLAIDFKGNAYINNPWENKLITKYNSSGKVIQQFGERTTIASLYGTAPDAQRAESAKVAANAVSMVTDDEGFLYAAYLVAPVFRKYSPDGSLVFERHLDGPAARQLVSLFWSYKPASGGMSTGVGGAQVPYILKDIAFDSDTKRLYILAANDLFKKNAVFELDKSGRQIRVFTVGGQQNGLFYRLAAANGKFYLTTLFAPGVFSCDIPK